MIRSLLLLGCWLNQIDAPPGAPQQDSSSLVRVGTLSCAGGYSAFVQTAIKLSREEKEEVENRLVASLLNGLDKRPTQQLATDIVVLAISKNRRLWDLAAESYGKTENESMIDVLLGWALVEIGGDDAFAYLVKVAKDGSPSGRRARYHLQRLCFSEVPCDFLKDCDREILKIMVTDARMIAADWKTRFRRLVEAEYPDMFPLGSAEDERLAKVFAAGNLPGFRSYAVTERFNLSRRQLLAMFASDELTKRYPEADIGAPAGFIYGYPDRQWHISRELKREDESILLWARYLENRR